MEKQPENNKGVQITKAVFDGFEFIRTSGATNMLDRPMVINLAREWDFHETADWIESVDTRTYGELIFKGPDVINDDLADEVIENDFSNQGFDSDPPYSLDEQETTQPVIEDDFGSRVHDNDVDDEDDQAEKLNRAMDDERATMRDAIIRLSKIATLTIADTYETEEMGVQFTPDRREIIQAERNRLNQSLGEVSRLWTELNETITEVQRGVGSLQYMIDPEPN